MGTAAGHTSTCRRYDSRPISSPLPASSGRVQSGASGAQSGEIPTIAPAPRTPPLITGPDVCSAVCPVLWFPECPPRNDRAHVLPRAEEDVLFGWAKTFSIDVCIANGGFPRAESSESGPGRAVICGGLS